jgi:hypothetical protein
MARLSVASSRHRIIDVETPVRDLDGFVSGPAIVSTKEKHGAHSAGDVNKFIRRYFTAARQFILAAVAHYLSPSISSHRHRWCDHTGATLSAAL